MLNHKVITINVLVVEDNLGDFILVEEYLCSKPETFKLLNVKSCTEAKSILTHIKKKFDIILLDLSLPDKTGIELVNEIIMLCTDLPIIVLTGYPDADFGLKSLSIGVSDYLVKDELNADMLYKSVLYSLERKRYTLALTESDNKYSKLFHLSPIPMWVVDSKTLQFIDVNKASIVQYGYSRDEFLNMTLNDILWEKEVPKLEQFIPGANQESGNCHIQVHIHKKRNGELRNAEIQSTPIIYNGTDANIVIANDVTERLYYIKAIEDQNKKLKEISWMQSHMVRAPLARIMALVPLIAEAHTTENDIFEEVLDYILKSACELDKIIMEINTKTNIEVRDNINLKTA